MHVDVFVDLVMGLGKRRGHRFGNGDRGRDSQWRQQPQRDGRRGGEQRHGQSGSADDDLQLLGVAYITQLYGNGGVRERHGLYRERLQLGVFVGLVGNGDGLGLD
jgi:hypothetical protein